jgi:hypothetical protein
MRAHANGKYDNHFSPKKATLSYGEKNDIFTNEEQHDLFANLVGEDYESFAFNMQNISSIPKSEKDDFDAKVFVGSVVGLASTNEAIIMRDDLGLFWAGVIVYYEGDDQFIVKYFTNDKERKKRIPQTIEEWRQGFSDYEVIL